MSMYSENYGILLILPLPLSDIQHPRYAAQALNVHLYAVKASSPPYSLAFRFALNLLSTAFIYSVVVT